MILFRPLGVGVLMFKIMPRYNWSFSSDVKAMEQTKTRLDRADFAYVISQDGFFIKTLAVQPIRPFSFRLGIPLSIGE